jgi:UDP-glucose 4-epimerase
MKVFISGVAGFLGSHLADELLSEGCEVVGVDNLIGGYQDNIPAGVDFHKKDCLDLPAMNELLKGVEVVIHAACTAYEGLSVFSPAFVCNNTAQATVSLLSAAVSNKIKRFVYCSSMARYGTQDVVPFNEDMECKPQDPYGISKLSSEMLVRNICETHGIDFTILVPHNIIGARQRYDDPFRNVASIMINRCLQGKPPVIYGNGEQKRCFSFIEDCVYCIKEATYRKEVLGEVINIGPDSSFVSINELAVLVQEVVGTSFQPIYLEPRPQEVFLASCSANKARKLLGYDEKVNLFDGLSDIHSYIMKRGVMEFSYNLPIEINTLLTPKSWTERII